VKNETTLLKKIESVLESWSLKSKVYEATLRGLSARLNPLPN